MDDSLSKFKSGLHSASSLLQKSRAPANELSVQQRSAIERYIPYAGVSPSSLEGAAPAGGQLSNSNGYGAIEHEPEEEEEDDSLDHATTQRLLLDIIQLLKKTKKPLSVKQISATVGVDISTHPKLLKKLLYNDKVYFDPERKLLNYVTAFNVQSKQDIFRLVESQAFEGGVEAVDLEDTFPDCTNKIFELEKERKIVVVRNKDNSPRVLYYNVPDYNIDMDEEFKTRWHDLRFTHAFDLAAELEAAGMQTSVDALQKKETEKQLAAATATQKAIMQARKRKIGRGSKRVKITNTHIEGLDLTKDYVASKPS